MLDSLRHIDHQLFQFINQTMACALLDSMCVWLRGKSFLFIFYGALTYRIYSLYPKQFLKIIIAGAVTFLLTDQISSHLIKPFVHRLRPCNNPEIDVRLLLEKCGAGFSFVSAHAANSFGMAAFVSSIRMKTKTILILGTWASLVSFSQVYVGVHFPADVIGGAIVGIIIGSSTAFILKTKFGSPTNQLINQSTNQPINQSPIWNS